MKTIISAIVALFMCSTAHALTIKAAQNYMIYTVDTIQTTTTANYSDTIPLGTFSDMSVQCDWASVTGTQPQYSLQTSNDGSNWDTLSGALTVTTGASGSETWIIDSIPVKNARVKITTASTTGTLDCTAIAHGK